MCGCCQRVLCKCMGVSRHAPSVCSCQCAVCEASRLLAVDAPLQCKRASALGLKHVALKTAALPAGCAAGMPKLKRRRRRRALVFHDCSGGGSVVRYPRGARHLRCHRRMKCRTTFENGYSQRHNGLEQIHFEMLHISKFSFSRKCDFQLNPRHVVARCTFVQR